MATYYKWQKNELTYKESDLLIGSSSYTSMLLDKTYPNRYYYQDSKPEIKQDEDGYYYDFSNASYSEVEPSDSFSISTDKYYANNVRASSYVIGARYIENDGDFFIFTNPNSSFYSYNLTHKAGDFIEYVYNTKSNAYPNGGVQDGYYYDQRTTVTSPTAPTGLTYPNPITTPTVTVSWQAADSNTDYPIDHYTLTYRTEDSGAWNHFGPETANLPPDTTSYQVKIPTGVTQIMLKVQAWDTNNKGSDDCIGPLAPVFIAPTLTVPQMVMQGQQATVSWSAIEGADSYTLQRKSSADADWVEVYSGTDTTFTETVGTWTSLQYRVQAVFDGTPGGWATSDSIQIVSASALVISGQDGDLGTLVNDVPYSISSDQTSPTIDVTVEVNGGEYAAFQATSGQTYKVGVLDLPTGTGSIVITASTTVSESPVTVTRTWTYSKTAQTFPNSGSVATLTKEGNVVYPETLIEAVRASMTPWGGNLSTALNLLKNAALFNRTKQPKYSEVTVSLSGKTEGQTIQLPENGRMVEFYVAKLDYESALNGAGRVLLVRKDCYDERAWDAVNVNVWASSDLLTWLNGTYKGLFPEEVQTAMGTTTYYYTPGNGNNTVTTRSDAVFSLSATELGLSQTWFNVEGSALPIVNTLKIAYLNGNANTQWTRTPNTSAVTHAILLNTSGSVGNGACNYSAGARPCFTLPSTFSGTYYVDQNGGIHDAQEYTEAGDWLDVWGNAIPAVKIETGSYVGTGTSGSSNPNTLTFGFEPKFLLVMKEGSQTITGSFGLIWSGNSKVGARSIFVNDTGISWYSTSSSSPVDDQCNTFGTTYHYVAIG